jgi:hypothetical protein
MSIKSNPACVLARLPGLPNQSMGRREVFSMDSMAFRGESSPRRRPWLRRESSGKMC